MAEIELTITSQISGHLANMRKAEQAEERLKQKRKDSAKAVKAAEKEVQNATKETVKAKLQELAQAKATAATYDRLGKKNQQVKKRELAETKALTREQGKLGREAKRVYEGTRTPMEQYQTRLKRLKQMTREAGMTQETYRRGVRKLKEEYRGAGKAGRGAFGAGALGDLKSYAMGFMALPAVIGAATSALREMQQVRDELAEKQRTAAFSLGRLATLGEGDPDKTKALMQSARQFHKLGGAGDLREAADATFEIFSADPKATDADLKFMARLSTVDKPAAVAGGAGTIMRALGRKETGSFKALASKATAAAGPASGVDPGQIIQGMTEAAEAAKSLGLSDEELFGAISIISQKTGSAQKAGTRVNALLRSLGRRGFVEEYKGKPLAEMLESIGAKGMTMPEEIKYFGRQEAQQAFSALKPSELRTWTATMHDAQKSGTIGKVVDEALKDPIVREAFKGRKTKGRREVAGEPLGLAASGVQRVVDTVETPYLERGDEAGAWAVRQAGRAARFAYGDTALSGPAEGARFGIGKVLGAGPGTNPAYTALVGAAGLLANAAEDISRAVRARPVKVME